MATYTDALNRSINLEYERDGRNDTVAVTLD